MLHELVPSLDKSKAKRVARQLASLCALQSIDRNIGRECLKLRLKKVSNKLLSRQRQACVPKVSGVEEVSPKDTIEEEVSPNDTSEPSSVNLIQAKVDRHHLLINKVGETRYNDIVSVSQEIKEIRQQSAFWTKFSPRSSSSEAEDHLPACKAFPTPIADLYFRAPLIDVMRIVDAKTSLTLNELCEPCSCIVQQTDWDPLLEDAKTKLATYRKFEKENVEEDEVLTFSCRSGMCFFS